MRAALRAVVFFVVVAGCSKEWRPLDASILAKQPARTIGVVSSKPATGFQARTAARSMTGLIGLAVISGAGGQIIEENQIADPALSIANRILVALAGKYGLSGRTPKPISAPGEHLRWDTDLYLEVRTENWGLTYFPADWAHYRAFYEASIELHDSRTQRVIASGQCLGPFPEDSTGAPTYEEMLWRRAEILKQRLQEEAAACAQRFSRELFAIQLPEDHTAPPPPPADAKIVYASCHLEETPDWKAADAAGKHRLLQECWDKRGTPPAAR